DGPSRAFADPRGGGGSRGGGKLALIRTLPHRGPPVCDGDHILLHFGPASRPPARALIPATVPANPLVGFAILPLFQYIFLWKSNFSTALCVLFVGKTRSGDAEIAQPHLHEPPICHRSRWIRHSFFCAAGLAKPNQLGSRA